MARTKKFDQDVVLEKAINLFWESGYNGTSMQNLIDGLGINRASLYDTFGSKKELYDRALKKYHENELAATADFLYYQTNVRQGLYLLMERMIDAAINVNAHGCFLVNACTELANSDKSVKQQVNDNKVAFEEMYFNYLQYGVNQSQISPYKDLKSIATYLYALQTSVKVISKIDSNKEVLLKVVSNGLGMLD